MDKNGFIKYLESKNLALRTINEYVRLTELFFAKVKKEDIQIVKPDVLKFLEYLKNKKGIQNASRQISLFAVNHYFTYLYKAGRVAKNPCLFLKIQGVKRKMLYKIYSSEELDQLFDTYYQLFICNFDDSYIPENMRKRSALGKGRNALILSILINQGIGTNEIGKMEVGDVDLLKATIKIKGGKKLNDRTLPLKATQIGLFLNYLQNVRPQLVEYQTKESEKLFLPLPTSNKKTDNCTACRTLAEQVKTIDKQFINFLQVRTSVISFWIKTLGLRKAQHLAGHRSISCTEKYLLNNLDGLIDDINKLHPFDF